MISVERPPLLIGLHHRMPPRSARRGVAREHGRAFADAIAAMGDERTKRLAARIVRLEERADRWRRGSAQIGKSEEYLVIARDVVDPGGERRLVPAVALARGLGDVLLVIAQDTGEPA